MEKIPIELLHDIGVARTEYLFQQIKIPESYTIFLSKTKLTEQSIEHVIRSIFQTIAKFDDDKINSEDQYLTHLLKNII